MSDSSFVDALRYGSTLAVAQFTIYKNGVPLGTTYNANVSTGTFTVDRNSENRRTGTLTIEPAVTVPPDPLLPTNPTSILAPFGNEVFLEQGITANGDLSQVTWFPLGLFVITTTTVDDTNIDLTATLELYDRSWTIQQRALKNPYNVPATESGNFIDEIEALLNMIWVQDPDMAPLQYNIVPTDAVIPTASYDQGSDPWEAALDMADAIGYELFFNVTGVCTGNPIPNPAIAGVSWNYTDDTEAILGYGGTGSTSLLGSAYSTPVETEVVMTRDGIYNDIVVQGTGDETASTYTDTDGTTTDEPILAEAADTNPQSWTYVNGPMGDVPDFIQSSLTTSVGALPYAQNQLQVQQSSTWQVTISIPPNPSIDIDNVVTITRAREGLNNARCVVDTISTSISYADVMQITCRIISNVNTT